MQALQNWGCVNQCPPEMDKVIRSEFTGESLCSGDPYTLKIPESMKNSLPLLHTREAKIIVIQIGLGIGLGLLALFIIFLVWCNYRVNVVNFGLAKWQQGTGHLENHEIKSRGKRAFCCSGKSHKNDLREDLNDEDKCPNSCNSATEIFGFFDGQDTSKLESNSTAQSPQPSENTLTTDLACSDGSTMCTSLIHFETDLDSDNSLSRGYEEPSMSLDAPNYCKMIRVNGGK
ncbi:hypothetical protein Ciccas_001921 [Cichlidogyrus casuarinus]|uniref:Uncharacterized protein n=1 Tax=Cichlidogyrus casuarinus TaxID=1844966 RepID=A0ABD2QKY7_9PLAT